MIIIFDFDYIYEAPSKEEYIIDSDYRKVILYTINHENKTINIKEFNYFAEIRDYILENNIKSVIFYGVGFMHPLYEDLKNNNILCSVDRNIYSWRMTLPSELRNRTRLTLFYEVRGYEYIK